MPNFPNPKYLEQALVTNVTNVTNVANNAHKNAVDSSSFVI